MLCSYGKGILGIVNMAWSIYCQEETDFRCGYSLGHFSIYIGINPEFAILWFLIIHTIHSHQNYSEIIVNLNTLLRTMYTTELHDSENSSVLDII